MPDNCILLTALQLANSYTNLRFLKGQEANTAGLESLASTVCKMGHGLEKSSESRPAWRRLHMSPLDLLWIRSLVKNNTLRCTSQDFLGKEITISRAGVQYSQQTEQLCVCTCVCERMCCTCMYICVGSTHNMPCFTVCTYEPQRVTPGVFFGHSPHYFKTRFLTGL